MRILLDTNVVLDVLLKREPWVSEASAIWQANDDGRLVGHLMASALTDIFYVARRLADREAARAAVETCLEAFEFCPVDRHALELAHLHPGADFEDNLQMVCAEIAQLDAIVTRDPDDFKAATVAVLTPTQILAQLS
ncbi:MAG: PIN domain-containing protein [Caldilinea sp.]